MKMLITGANGFVGRPLCAKFLTRQMSVRAALRSAQACLEGVEVAMVGEISGDTDWGKALADIDVVIHLAARVHVMQDSSSDPLTEFRRINVAGTENLARQAAASGVKRLVYVSSIKVNGEATCGGARFSETDMDAPQDPYGVSKCEAEHVLHQVAAETGSGGGHCPSTFGLWRRCKRELFPDA